MLPAAGLQDLGFAVGSELHLLAASDLANARDRNPGNLFRDAATRMGREEQLVFVSAVQREGQSIFARHGRQKLGVNHSASFALLADVPEVGGKSVAYVDHRR